jgi:hypothetical protein
MKARRFSIGSVALTNAYQRVPLTAVPATDPDSREFPWDCWVDRIEVQLTAIAGGATKTYAVLCADAGGDRLISHEDNQTITPGQTTPLTVGTTIHPVDGYFCRAVYSVAGVVYVAMKLDAGTATAVIRAYHEQQAD